MRCPTSEQDDERLPAWLDALVGGAAGLMATLPMSAFMLAARERLPKEESRPLPPRQIVRNLLHATALRSEVDRSDELLFTGIAHFGFGAAMGASWGLLARKLPIESIVGGVSYGLVVWAGSYQGWLPASGLHRPATRQSAGRNALMILAHVVWGATLAVTGQAVRGRLLRAESRVTRPTSPAEEEFDGQAAIPCCPSRAATRPVR